MQEEVKETAYEVHGPKSFEEWAKAPMSFEGKGPEGFDPREALGRLGWDRIAALHGLPTPRELAVPVPGGKRMPLKVKRCLNCRKRPEVRIGGSLGFVPMGFPSLELLEMAQEGGDPLGLEVRRVDVLPCCARRTV